MLVRINPRRITIGDGYHGCHGVVHLLARLTGLRQLPLDCEASALGPGDVVHVETPVNPTGEARGRRLPVRRRNVCAAAAAGPLCTRRRRGHAQRHQVPRRPLGHAVRRAGGAPRLYWAGELREERLVLGAVMGSLEGWLGLRSLRTLELRVARQSAMATALVAWLVRRLGDAETAVGALVERVQHASLQPEAADAGGWLRRQMPGGFGAVFAMCLKDEGVARALPSRLRLFHHATSLGGVESLIEWRAMTDPRVDRRLVRVSVGVEALEDLQEDLECGLESLREA